MADRYGGNGPYRIVVTQSDVSVKDVGNVHVWHWARLDENGTQIDGSGAQRDGEQDLAKLERMLKKQFPKDEVEGLGG